MYNTIKQAIQNVFESYNIKIDASVPMSELVLLDILTVKIYEELHSSGIFDPASTVTTRVDSPIRTIRSTAGTSAAPSSTTQQ